MSRHDLSRYWFEKARESLESAKSETQARRLTFAVNRLYYALFYAFTSVLIARGTTYTKHSAVRASLHRDYVRTGLVSKELGRLYDELFHARQQGDYAPLVEFDPKVVEQQILDVEQALDMFKSLLEEALKGQ